MKKASHKRIRRLKVRAGSRPGEWITPDLKGMSMRQALDVCGKLKCDAVFKGTGFAVKQSPKPGATFREGAELRVLFKGQSS
jgi:hypothetical protein